MVVKRWMLGVGLCGLASAMALNAQTGTPVAPHTPLPMPGAAPGVSANPVQGDLPSSAAPVAPVQFPTADPKNFTAANPTPQTVDSFLHAVWGLDTNREWRVAAIRPSSAPGFVRVDVLVADKRQPARINTYTFLVTPDGKHAVSGELAPFGAKPFTDLRATLQQRADGPARGSAGKELELVEFADLQCAACKAAQSTMDQIAQDFPQAHIVYQDVPLGSNHPYAMQAAEVGQCVRQAKGDPAFFVYAQKVYDTQADLTAAKADAALRAAVTAAGGDPASTMTCASQPATKAAIDAGVQLATDVGVNGTPTLAINGRVVPLGQVPYPTLKKLIVFQGEMDGVAVKEQPSLSNLK